MKRGIVLKKKRYQITLVCVIAAVGLLCYARDVSDWVRTGLLSCANVIIPSLFPFMILSSVIVNSPAGDVLSGAVSSLTHPLGLPKNLGCVFLMSFLGGFPVGARMLSGMYEKNEISKDTAERALCCCVNAGPSFLISAVGVGMIGSIYAGILLLCAQVISSLFICILAFRGQSKQENQKITDKAQTENLFVGAVRDASAGILSICGFVVAFSAIISLLRSFGVIQAVSVVLAKLFPSLGELFFTALLTGMLEVTNGCIAATKLNSFHGFLLCAFLVSFSSLSIIFQVRSCFSGEKPLNFSRFYRSRLLHGGFTTLFACIFWKLLPSQVLSAAAITSAPVMNVNPNMAVSSACLIAMCTLLVLQNPKHTSK